MNQVPQSSINEPFLTILNSKGGWNVFEAVSILAGIGNFTWLIIIGLSSEGMKSTKK